MSSHDNGDSAVAASGSTDAANTKNQKRSDPDLESIKTRVREMEEEHQKLKEMTLEGKQEAERHFHGCGSINRVTILQDRFTGHPKGHAYDEFLETATALLGDISKHATDVNQIFKAMLNNIKNGQQFRDGVSFLDAKNECLMSYMIELCNIMLTKLDSKSLVDSPSINRSIELRVTMDKIKPIQQRLSYQLDKLLNASNIPNHRVNLENIVVDDPESGDDDPESGDDDNQQIEDDEEVSDEETETKSSSYKSGVYKPPKLRAMAYDSDEDGTGNTKNKRRQQKAALNKVVMDDIRQELDDAPLEIRDKVEKEGDHDKRLYEEENFTRLVAPSSKRKSRALSKKKRSKKLRKR